MDLAHIESLENIMEKLSEGIDPFTGYKLESDTLLNNNQLKKNFNDIYIILKEITDSKTNINSVKRKTRIEFKYIDKELDNIEFTNQPITIGEFVNKINLIMDTKYMKKIRAGQITKWLVENGYLDEIEHDDGKIFKIINEKSKTIGISDTPKESLCGRKYSVNLYNIEAQKFIINNINNIILNS